MKIATCTNIVAITRAELGLSQAEFGRWLAERLSKDRPIPWCRVSEWERGIRAPRLPVRKACAPVVADAAVRMANAGDFDGLRRLVESVVA